MSFCDAFTEYLNPCLMACSHNGLCILHQTYYDPEEWFERHIFSPNRNLYCFSSGAKIQSIYKKAILDGRVKITRDHFRDLDTSHHPESLVDYYLICCKQPGVDPLWSKKLFNNTIKQILTMHRPDIHPIVSMNRNLLDRFLEPLFNTSYRSFEYMVSYVLFSIMSLEVTDGVHKGAVNLDKSVSLLQYIKDHPKFHSEILLGQSYSIENLLQVTNPARDGKIVEFLRSLPDQRRAFREQRYEKNKEMREEISYAVWRPESYLGFEEYRDLKARWNLSLQVQ